MYDKTGVKTTIATSRTGALHQRAEQRKKNRDPNSGAPSCSNAQFLCAIKIQYFTAWLLGCVDKLAPQTTEAVPNNFLMAPLMRWQHFQILGTKYDTVLGCVWLKVWYEWVGTVTVPESHLTNDL